MNAMFRGCQRLTALDLRGFDTGNVSDFDNIFADCSALHTLQLPERFVTSEAGNMSYMFQNCAALTGLDVSGFDTQNVTNLSYVFDGCASLKTLNFSGWDTRSATTTEYMFQGCNALTGLEIRHWNMGNVTTIEGMFNGCATIHELDLSGWDLTSNTNIYATFSKMSNLETLKLNNIHSGTVAGTTAAANYKCNALLNSCYNLKRLEAINSEFCFASSAALGTAFPDGTWKYYPMRSGAPGGYNPDFEDADYVEADGEVYNVTDIQKDLLVKTFGGSRAYYLPSGIYERVATQSAGFEDKPATDYIIDRLENPVLMEKREEVVANGNATAYYYKMDRTAQSRPFDANGKYSVGVDDSVGSPLLKLRFPKAAIDINGVRHDLIFTINSLTLPELRDDEERYESLHPEEEFTQYYVGSLLSYSPESKDFSINDRRYLSLEPLQGGSGGLVGPIQVGVNLSIDGATEGTFLLYASDLDVAELSNQFERNAEGVIFGDGFHLDTLVRGDETITQWAYNYRRSDNNELVLPSVAQALVGSTHHYENGNVVPNEIGGVTYTREYVTNDAGVPNHLIGTRGDSGTYLSGFFAAGDATGANFIWTAGKGCGTTFLGGGGVSVVKIEKLNQDDEPLAGARLQLHNERGELIGEWDSEANKTKNFILNSGLYRLSEVSAPGGRQLADDIWFRVNPDGTISVSVTGKDGHYLTQLSDDGSATAALEMINRFFTIERVVGNERVKGDIEIIKKDAETGLPMSGVAFKLMGVPDISGKYQYVQGVENPGDTEVTNYYFREGSTIGFPRDAAGNFVNFNTYKLKREESGATGADGRLTFTDIEQGVYVLTETTPEHYQALEDRYWVKIDEEGNATLYRQAGAGATTVTIDEDNQLTLPGGVTPVTDKTIENKRVRHDLTVSKTVSGNMGSKAKYFKVTVALTDETYASATGTNTYAIDLSNADAAPDGHTNPTSVTVKGGAGSVELWLRHGQTATVKDLPHGIKYTVSEAADGYDATYSLNGGSAANGGSTGPRTLTADASVDFANKLEASTPTGIADSVAPALWGGLMALLLAGLVCAGGKKRRAR